MDDLLDNLNQPQKEAVLATDGPVLILAGAGSGKTKALTHRIAYLIREKNISPYNILAVTFTNKAAGEMQNRVAILLSQNHVSGIMPCLPAGRNHGEEDHNSSFIIRDSANEIRIPWLGTFHSVCVKILRREAHYLGYERSFTIYDAGDQLSIIKRIMRDLNIDPKIFAPKSVQYFISGAKNELMMAEDYKKYINSPFETVVHKVYVRYEKYLHEANGMDFDDLIMQCVLLFQQNPTVLQKYQDLFKYILIDEYQDTNHAQYLWAKLLAEKHKNIMVVGDDYQAIYSWRGANFRNILNFEKHYPKAKVIKLEQNYRSTKTILSAGNEVIKYNKQRTDKKLWTDNKEGLPITVYKALNERDEAEFVTLEIKSLVNRRQITDNSEKKLSNCQTVKLSSYNDFAVLYRTNAQSRAIEETLIRFKIPYKIVGGFRFYERKEIKDIVSYLRVIQNPMDFESLERAAISVSRGLGEKTLMQIREISKSEFLNPKQIQNSKISKKLIDFLILIEELRKQAEDIRLDDLIMLVATKSGYKKFVLDGTPEGEGRWENILELQGVAQEVSNSQFSILNKNPNDKLKNDQINEKWELENENSETALERFLEQVALVQDTDNLSGSGETVTLMTLHSAKGLEFKTVFIIGAEEGLFPHSRAIVDESEMEEERRLAYVGITRAKERLYLIYAGERNIYGRFQSNPKSRFIENIPEGLIDEI